MNAIEARDLTFRYPGGAAAVFAGVSLAVPVGARCLLFGGNGVGKSTLLRLCAGRHMLPPAALRIFGRPAFEDTTLAAEVAFLGGPFPFDVDLSVGEILQARSGIDPARRARVLEILDVDPAWRMHRVSDGQRRRVQILLELERPLRLILLDEVTAELDVVARADLLAFLREESERRQLTVVYASHVLDGLAEFGTDVAFLSPGRLRMHEPIDRALARFGSLARLCDAWMREDRRALAERPAPAPMR